MERSATTLLMPDGVRLAADVHRPAHGAGRAPLLLLHGTLVSRLDYRSFAPLLAAAWGGDVVVPDRRGRDASLPQPANHSLLTEADDLDAMVAATGAAAVVGHSYGGTVTLLAAGRNPGAWTWATYDAALNPAGVLAAMWRPELRERLDAGDLDTTWALLVGGLRTAGPVSRLPGRVLARLGHVLAGHPGAGARMYAALPGSVRELESVLELVAQPGNQRASARLDSAAADASAQGDSAQPGPATGSRGAAGLHAASGSEGTSPGDNAPAPGAAFEAPAEEPFPLPERGLMLNGALSPSYFRDATRFAVAAHPGLEHGLVPWGMHNAVMLPAPVLARRIARWCLEHPAVPPALPVPTTVVP